MSIAPCKDCQDDRHIGCHGTCEKYIEWKKRQELHKANIEANRAQGKMLRSVKRDACEKQRRRHKR